MPSQRPYHWETQKLDLINDVEVGVYFSAAGGVEAGWHYDNNHNITIQLYGTKDWHTMPSGRETAGGLGFRA